MARNYNPLRWPRRRRRRATLQRAKEILHEDGRPRRELADVWRTLMRIFPDGTVPRAEAR